MTAPSPGGVQPDHHMVGAWEYERVLTENARLRALLLEAATAMGQAHRARSRGDDRAEQQAEKWEAIAKEARS